MDHGDLNPNNLINFALKMMNDPNMLKEYLKILEDVKKRLEEIKEEKIKEKEEKKKRDQ